MIIFPILNFVLPLIYTSFVFVGNPQLSCTECSKKNTLRFSESKKTILVEQTNQVVIKADLTEESNSGKLKMQIPVEKEE